MRNKSSFSFEGKISLTKGIPKGLYTDEQIQNLINSNPNVDVLSFITGDDPVYQKNTILDIGKKTALSMLFRQIDGEGVISYSFSDMAIGDGGYDFGAQTQKFPYPTDSGLYNMVSTPIAITSFQAVSGNTLEGFSKLVAATFFSSNYNHDDYRIQNQTDFFINEAGILDRNGNFFNKVTFSNFPFDPLDNLAMTINWEIKVR